MSQVTWRVQGYGWEIREDLLDPEKMKADGLDPEEITEYASALANKSKFLCWATTCDNEWRYFLLLTPDLPWQFNDEEKRLTPRDVEEEISRIVSPYLIEGAVLQFEIFDEEAWG